MTHVRRIGVLSLGMTMGALYACIGLIAGAFVSLFAILGSAIGAAAGDSSAGPMAAFGFLFGVGAIVLLPLFYGMLGFVVGLVVALVYNLVARFTGGIELELQ